MAHEDEAGPDAAWRRLADGEDPADALEVAVLLDTAPATHLGSALGSVVERLIGVLLLGGQPEVEAQMLAGLYAAAPRAAGDQSALSFDGPGLIVASTLFTCLTGSSPIGSPDAFARRWAPEAAQAIDELDDDCRNDWALICAAHGLDQLVERFLADPPPILDPVRLAREVIAAPGDRAAIRRSWQDFVAGFPLAYEEGSRLLTSLLHAGWAVEVRVGGGRPQQVLTAFDAATGLRLAR